MSYHIDFIGFIFNASQYPSIWLPGKPNGSNDTNGRYVVMTNMGMKDVGIAYQIAEGMCMRENETYSLHMRTTKYYRLDIHALVNQTVARRMCEVDGGRRTTGYPLWSRQ
jgi:hypothetical protein